MKVIFEKMMEQLSGEKLLLVFYREHLEVEKWWKQVWLNHFEERKQ